MCGGPAPYCIANSDGDGARCSATPLPTCPPSPVSFSCTGLGVFPDPADCHKFYNCYQATTGGPIIAQAFTCPNLYVFDPSGPKNPDYCRLTNNFYCTTSGCGVNDIKNVALSYAYFPATKGQYVATCQRTSPAIVIFCPPNYDVNVSTLPASCVMTCKNPFGKTVLVGTTNQYYICAWNGLGYTPTIQTCLGSKVFSTTVKDCV